MGKLFFKDGNTCNQKDTTCINSIFIGKYEMNLEDA